MIDIQPARGEDLQAVVGLYAKCGYGGGVDANDQIVIARIDGQMAGAVRLCNEASVTVLRGMQILPAFQRQGIGHALLAACVPHLNRRVAHCLPYAYLLGFYASAGFEPADVGTVPPFLGDRLSSYLASGQDVIVMTRKISAKAI